MTKFETRTLKISVVPEGESIFSEKATEIEIVDEGGGEFVKATQSYEGRGKSLAFDPGEWEAIRQGIDKMIGECRG